MPKHEGDPNYILNPKSGKYVKKDGPTGAAILGKTPKRRSKRKSRSSKRRITRKGSRSKRRSRKSKRRITRKGSRSKRRSRKSKRRITRKGPTRTKRRSKRTRARPTRRVSQKPKSVSSLRSLSDIVVVRGSRLTVGDFKSVLNVSIKVINSLLKTAPLAIVPILEENLKIVTYIVSNILTMSDSDLAAKLAELDANEARAKELF